jgi:2-polyprenyl-3-methyl-5-hydroxy-6-metoxy-1,4-benzoquinol methylase
MKKELDEQFYNAAFKSGGYNQAYFKHYSQIEYFHSWKVACDWLIKDGLDQVQLLDIGCGPGQFAHMLYDLGLKSYIGFDFSDEAISQAQQRVPEWKDHFFIQNAYLTELYELNTTHVSIFEVLEHIDYDLDVLAKIKSGTTVLASVPNFDSKGHVRTFQNENEIQKHYGNILDIQQIIPIPMGRNHIIFMFKSIKK